MSRKSSLRLQAKLRLHHHLLLVLRLSHKVALQQNQLAPCSVPCRSFRRVEGDSEPGRNDLAEAEKKICAQRLVREDSRPGSFYATG